MRYERVTPPADLITLAEAKAHLRVDHSEEDALITALIATATQRLDGRSGILNRALVTQTWRAYFSDDNLMEVDHLMIDLSPIIDVTQVRVKANSIWGVFSNALWTWRNRTHAALVRPVINQSWPAMDVDEESIEITFTCGFGAASDVPAPIKQAALIHIGTLYKYREQLASFTVSELPHSYDALIAPYRFSQV